MKLNITKGRQSAPDRILIYGRPGVGKSTFAAGAPSPLFLDIEHGTNALDVDRVHPTTYREVIDAIEAVPTDYKTVVIDTIDALEKLIHAEVCKKYGWDTIEAPGYGKGYAAALDTFGELLRALDGLRARGVEVILLGHSAVRNITNPSGLDYTKHELAIHQKAVGVVTAWCDTIGFADIEHQVNKDEKVTVTGRRVIRLAPGAWDAKCRLRGAPATISTDFAAYASMRAELGPKADDAADLFAKCLRLLEVVDDPTGKARAHVEANRTNAAALTKALAKLTALAGKD